MNHSKQFMKVSLNLYNKMCNITQTSSENCAMRHLGDRTTSTLAIPPFCCRVIGSVGNSRITPASWSAVDNGFTVTRNVNGAALLFTMGMIFFTVWPIRSAPNLTILCRGSATSIYTHTHAHTHLYSSAKFAQVWISEKFRKLNWLNFVHFVDLWNIILQIEWTLEDISRSKYRGVQWRHYFVLRSNYIFAFPLACALFILAIEHWTHLMTHFTSHQMSSMSIE